MSTQGKEERMGLQGKFDYWYQKEGKGCLALKNKSWLQQVAALWLFDWFRGGHVIQSRPITELPGICFSTWSWQGWNLLSVLRKAVILHGHSVPEFCHAEASWTRGSTLGQLTFLQKAIWSPVSQGLVGDQFLPRVPVPQVVPSIAMLKKIMKVCIYFILALKKGK